MKKSNYHLFLFLSIFWFSTSSSNAQLHRILKYDVDIHVNSNRSITAKETLNIKFSQDSTISQFKRVFNHSNILGKHGKKEMFYTFHNIKQNGKPINFSKKRTEDGIQLTIEIDHNHLHPISNKLSFEYSVKNQIAFNENSEDFDFQTITNSSFISVDSSNISINFTKDQDLISSSFILHKKGKEIELQKNDVSSSNTKVESIQNLTQNEFISSHIKFKKGSFIAPNFKEKYAVVFILLISFVCLILYYFITWKKYGKDLTKPKVYFKREPPLGLSPAACSYILSGRILINASVSNFIQLVTNKNIKIVPEQEDSSNFENNIYSIENISSEGIAYEDVKILHNELFKLNDKLYITKFNSAALTKATKKQYESLTSEYNKIVNAGKNRKFIIVPLLIVFLTTIVSAFISYVEPYSVLKIHVVVLYMFLGLISIIMYGIVIKREPIEKLTLLSHLEGFKAYLSSLEYGLTRTMPAEKVADFEKYVAYAYAFGLFSQWKGPFVHFLHQYIYKPEVED